MSNNETNTTQDSKSNHQTIETNNEYNSTNNTPLGTPTTTPKSEQSATRLMSEAQYQEMSQETHK